MFRGWVSSGAKLPNLEGLLGAASTTQVRIRVQESDAKLPSPRDNPQIKVQEKSPIVSE